MNSKTRRLTVSAIMIAVAAAISFVCNLIPFLNLPFGGTISIASMLPLILVSYMYGMKWGFLTGLAYSFVRMAIGYSTVSALFLPGDEQVAIWKALLICLLDYVLAYTAMGFGGAFRNKAKKSGALVCGSILALVIRYLVHIVSGAIFYGAWAEWFFGEAFFTDSIGTYVLNHFSGTSLSVLYSAVYNGCYMIPEIIISAIVAAAVSRIRTVKKFDI